MSTTRLQRYDFGTLRDFRGPIIAAVVEEIIVEAPPPPPPPTFSESEIEAARSDAKQAGYAEGFETGLAHANAQITAQQQAVDATVLKLGGVLNGLHHGYYQTLTREGEALSQLVLAIARKVAGDALATNTGETIMELVTKCLPFIVTKPKLTVELNPAAFDPTVDRIEKLLHSNGFEGEVQFRANPELAAHDVTLDWGIGQAQRSTAALWQEIESLLTTMPVALTMPEPAATPTATEQPTPSAEQNPSAPLTDSTPPTV